MVTRLLHYTFILFALSLPLSRGAMNFLSVLLLLFWILEGNFDQKVKRLKECKILLPFIGIFILTLLSAFFSDSLNNGFLAGQHRSLYQVIITHYLVIPLIGVVVITAIPKKVFKIAVSLFLVGIFLSEISSYLIFFDLIKLDYLKSVHMVYEYATPDNPSPFLQHIEYSVYLSIAILLLLQQLLTTKSFWLRLSITLFLISATMNLFINGGRTGQLIYVFAMLTFVLFRIHLHWKTVALTIFSLLTLLVIAYNASSTFHNRVNEAQSNIIQMQKGNFNTSWGQRAASNVVTVNYLTSSFKHFIFGAGAGDVREEYLEFAKENFPKNYHDSIIHLAHLHNQYLEYWMDGTIFSLLLFLLYFILLLRLSVPKEYKPLLYAFAIAVAIASLTDIPLFRYQPAMLVMFLTGYFVVLARDKE